MVPIGVSPFTGLFAFKPKNKKKTSAAHALLLLLLLALTFLPIGGSAGAGEGRGQTIPPAAGAQGLLGRLQEHERIPAAVPRRGHPCGKKVG